MHFPTVERMMKTQSVIVVASWLVAAICITLCHAGDGDLSKVELDMVVEDYGDSHQLRCHHCYRSVDGEACVNLEFSKVEVQDCMVDEPFCLVERLMTNNELTTFTRRCSRECKQGCQSVGNNYKLEYCYSCCQTDFCNEDNGAANYVTVRLPAVLLLTAAGYAMSAFISLG